MNGWFAALSEQVVAPDNFGRPRRTLQISVQHGQGTLVAPTEIHFDLDDLELVATRFESASVDLLVAAWPDPDTRSLVPWALTHALLPGPFAIEAHGDALCAIANAPDAAVLAERAFGPLVPWIPAAIPGHELARQAAAMGTGGCVLVGRVGFLAWGDEPEALLEQAASLEAAARIALGLAPTLAGVDEPRPISNVPESLVVSIRGRLSSGDRVLLATNDDCRLTVDRPDLDRIVTGARDLEPWITGELGWSMSGGDADRAVDPDSRVIAVPGLGLLAAGRTEDAATTTGSAARHVLATSAILADRYGHLAGPQDGHPTGSAPVMTPVLASPKSPGGPFEGRVYLVTGAGSGIGRDVARHLASIGASLALADLNAAAIDQFADELRAEGVRPVVVTGDLTDEAVADRLVTATIERFGGIDGAVLNAGIAIPGTIRELSLDDWRRSLEVNATSHFILTKRLLPILEAQGIGGSLVYIGSKNMFSPGAGFGAYSASKGALAQLARIVAIEAGPYGVRSNIVNPDNVFEGSALWSPELREQRAAVYGIRPDQLEDYYTQRNLLKVPIYGLDVARGVAFMLSDEAQRTTACVLTVDGGVPGVFPR